MKRRREVEKFADLLELRLQENDHKRGWKQDTASSLQKHLKEEVKKVDKYLKVGDVPCAIRESVDTAAMAMMVVDVLGGMMPKTCKWHDDCEAANEEARKRGWGWAEHDDK